VLARERLFSTSKHLTHAALLLLSWCRSSPRDAHPTTSGSPSSSNQCSPWRWSPAPCTYFGGTSTAQRRCGPGTVPFTLPSRHCIDARCAAPCPLSPWPSTVCASLLIRSSFAGEEPAKNAVGAAKASMKVAVDVASSVEAPATATALQAGAESTLESTLPAACNRVVGADVWPKIPAESSDTAGGAHCACSPAMLQWCTRAWCSACVCLWSRAAV